jgi:hypothetical protein
VIRVARPEIGGERRFWSYIRRRQIGRKREFGVDSAAAVWAGAAVKRRRQSVETAIFLRSTPSAALLQSQDSGVASS